MFYQKKQEEMGETMAFIPPSSWSSSTRLFYYHIPCGKTSTSLVLLPVFYRALNHHRNHLAERSQDSPMWPYGLKNSSLSIRPAFSPVQDCQGTIVFSVLATLNGSLWIIVPHSYITVCSNRDKIPPLMEESVTVGSFCKREDFFVFGHFHASGNAFTATHTWTVLTGLSGISFKTLTWKRGMLIKVWGGFGEVVE